MEGSQAERMNGKFGMVDVRTDTQYGEKQKSRSDAHALHIAVRALYQQRFATECVRMYSSCRLWLLRQLL